MSANASAGSCLTENQMRAEEWYPRYVQSVCDMYASTMRKFPNKRIQLLGIQPDNHPVFGARTRMEWQCLEKDILRALRAGSTTKIDEPEMKRIKFKFLAREIAEVNNKADQNHLIIASCPSRLGDDATVMDKVEAMVGSSSAIDICFSREGNVASILQEQGVFGVEHKTPLSNPSNESRRCPRCQGDKMVNGIGGTCKPCPVCGGSGIKAPDPTGEPAFVVRFMPVYIPA